MKLHELFDSPLDITYGPRSYYMFRGLFEINGREFEANIQEADDRLELWFSRLDVPEHYSISILNEDDAVLIFSTVAEFIREYWRLNEEKARQVYRGFMFTAKEPSRIRLYHTFAKRMVKEFGFAEYWTTDLSGTVVFYVDF